MKLRSLRLANFRQHAATALEFGDGITGLIGPNGTGKSTILEAIAWALYGNEAARGKRDGIRFLRADPKAPVRVELEFELAGHRLKIVRGLTSAELYLDDGESPIANSITTVNETVQRRIGMSRTEFYNTYFTGQKELAVMASLGPTERGQFLSRVLGYERLRSAQDHVRDRRRELNGELAATTQSLPDRAQVEAREADAANRLRECESAARLARSARDTAVAALTTVTPQWEQAERDRAERKRIIGELRVAENELAGRSSVRDDKARLADEAGRARGELDALRPRIAPYAALLEERERLEALRREEGRREELRKRERVVTDEMARVEAHRDALRAAAEDADAASTELVAQRDALRDAEAALEAAKTNWIRDRQEAETRREELRKQYGEIKNQRDAIVSAGENGLCPTCQRPLGTHFREMLGVLDAQMETVKLDGGYFRARLEELEPVPAAVRALDDRKLTLARAVAALERRDATAAAANKELGETEKTLLRHGQILAGVRAELATLPPGYDAARHDVVLRDIERLAPDHARAMRLEAAAADAPRLADAFAAADSSVNEQAQLVARLRTAMARVPGDDAAADALKAEREAASNAERAAAIAFATAELKVRTAQDDAARAAESAEALRIGEDRVRALTRARRLHQELDHAFAGLRTDLNAALRPAISRVASEFLAQLTDARYAELDLDDDYNLVIVEDGIPKPVISGGEEDLANLVLRLAISQMIAERAGHAFTLLILDEVFGSLDDVRRHNVVDLLRRLHDRFEQVILITHIESVRDGCDQVLAIRYNAESGAAIVETPPGASDSTGEEAASASLVRGAGAVGGADG